MVSKSFGKFCERLSLETGSEERLEDVEDVPSGCSKDAFSAIQHGVELDTNAVDELYF